MVYDRIARKQWSERAKANEVGACDWARNYQRYCRYLRCQAVFDINQVCLEKCGSLLLAAEAEYDRIVASRQQTAQ